ncbi:hypothetical protein [Streptomyces sp. NPDC048584]|uniref:hypothetical protein n=1 Tax=Streptomyces sp. NPDC048584 TaxID=3365573 RepID=UPI00371CFD12
MAAVESGTLAASTVGDTLAMLVKLISDIMACRFGVRLPADPGRDVLPSGHLRGPVQ